MSRSFDEIEKDLEALNARLTATIGKFEASTGMKVGGEQPQAQEPAKPKRKRQVRAKSKKDARPKAPAETDRCKRGVEMAAPIGTQVECPFCGWMNNPTFIYPCDCGTEFYQARGGSWWFDKDRKSQASENALWARVLRGASLGRLVPAEPTPADEPHS